MTSEHGESKAGTDKKSLCKETRDSNVHAAQRLLLETASSARRQARQGARVLNTHPKQAMQQHHNESGESTTSLSRLRCASLSSGVGEELRYARPSSATIDLSVMSSEASSSSSSRMVCTDFNRPKAIAVDDAKIILIEAA